MSATSSNIHLSGLARRLVLDKLLTEEVAQQAYIQASKEKVPFVSLLVKSGALSAIQIAERGSMEFGFPLLDLNSLDIQSAPTALVSEALIEKHHALPIFKRGNRLFVAVSDPTNLQALDEIKFHVGMNTEAVMVEEDKLASILEEVINAQDTSLSDLDDAELDNLDVIDTDAAANVELSENEADETPVVRFVNSVLLDAIRRGASDIHFEPYEKYFRVRVRQDGILQQVATPPLGLAPKLLARLKVMSKLDISERRVPQDGRIKMALSKTKSIDFRVSSCPTLWGEKIVLRILDAGSAMMGIEALGYEDDQKDLYMKALDRPHGMILVTGPTGSGKTVSLYTGVNILNTEDRNISTAEDPVEINLPGINQVHINNKVGLNFAAALRSFLRQDPDVVLVGEIRDLETAEIAVKAAQTGHLVLSTLHTNDAPQTLTRLVNMGVPPFNIASSVALIIAQRLLRRLCNNCKTPINIPREALLKEGFEPADLKGLELFSPVGCDKCNKGYKGRVGIYQVMPVTETIGRIIMEGGNAIQIADQAAKDGVIDLHRAGLQKAMAGVTSLEEVNRVTVE